MSTTQHTSHYNLPTFGDNPNDRPSWRGDFTDAMTKIDNQMYANATNITTATAAANNANTAAQQAKESANNAAELAQTNATNIAEQASYFNALGVSSPATAQGLMNTINGKAESTALTALQGTVSTLSDTVDGKANSSDVYTRSQADARYTQQGGYSGTAQALNQLISGNTSSISSLENTVDTLGDWHTAFSTGWENLGEFTSTCSPSNAIGADSRSNIQCWYNETVGAIKMFGMFAAHPISGQTQNFTSLSVVSQNALPESMRPAADLHMDAALAFCMNGISSDGSGDYTNIVTIPCCVTVKTTGIVLLGEHGYDGYSDNIVNHARQSFRVFMPQCIYLMQNFDN